MSGNGTTRREFLRAAGLGAASLAVPGVVNCGIGGRERLPNIVYILADDMGYGDPRCNNEESKIPTPNMDRLARGGRRFTDVHSPSAVCTPTRYGILTGRYCWRTHLKSGVLWGYSPNMIEPGRLTVPALLKKHGYSTAGMGKWHLGLGRDEKVDYSKPLHPGPNEHGFDYYFGIPASLDMEPYLYIENDRAVQQPTLEIDASPMPAFYRGGPIAPGFRHIDVMPTITERAVGFIRRHHANRPDSPFFLYFPLTAPHTPWLPVDFVKGRSKAGVYGDFVTLVDWTVGQVLDTLDSLGMTDNTLVILTSDNGADERFLLPEYGHEANYVFRGQKADIWDGGHRIPFFARWPGKIEAGSECAETICLTDLLATCAAIVGEKLPGSAGEDSYDILPAMLGKQTGEPIREATVHHSIEGMFSVRQGEWKLVLGRGSGGFGWKEADFIPKPGEAAGQLYNIAEDIAETRNLCSERRDVVERLTALLERYKEQGYSRPM